uniref:Major facilitator superfamily (MFS) profile domain-containing protein n=1 Tax=Timema genevievae TaxID=629358 RepID=A0A7R9JTH2_TIMGE|nr:unnamed protein product [Timema genevievae]
MMGVSVQIIREFCNTTVEATYGISMSSSQLNILWSTLVSIFLVGGVTGSLTGGWVADKFGSYVSLLYITTVIGTSFADHTETIKSQTFTRINFVPEVASALQGHHLGPLRSGLAPQFSNSLITAHSLGFLYMAQPHGVHSSTSRIHPCIGSSCSNRPRLPNAGELRSPVHCFGKTRLLPATLGESGLWLKSSSLAGEASQLAL